MIAPAPIRVLILEDSAIDAELMLHELRRAGLQVEAERVETEHDFVARLTPQLNLILSDNALPLFGSREALQLLRSSGLEVPFIIVSGSFREEMATEAILNGADAFLPKDDMGQLGPTVVQALARIRARWK